MRIKLHSVLVDDQAKALAFYTDVLGFRLKHDVPVGEFRWITVVSPDGDGEVEAVLEPNAHPAARAYQEAMFEAGIPLSAFEVDDLEAEVARLKEHRVTFVKEPVAMGPVSIAIFSDTCGNLIQIYQPTAEAAS